MALVGVPLLAVINLREPVLVTASMEQTHADVRASSVWGTVMGSHAGSALAWEPSARRSRQMTSLGPRSLAAIGELPVWRYDRLAATSRTESHITRRRVA